MNELRKLKRHVDIIERDLIMNPGYIRENIGFYMMDIDELEKIVQETESIYNKEFDKLCEKNINLILLVLGPKQKKKFFINIKGYINDIKLDLLSKRMYKFNIIKMKFEKIRDRIVQISFFT